MKVVTKGNSTPTGKRRVYFACHPNDFDRTFEDICNDIFATHDVAIYYADEKYEDRELYETDMKQMDLVVIPVTFNLLNKKNDAMDRDLVFAKKERIPVLPIMIEPDLVDDFSREDRFGKMEYLKKYEIDPTKISYEERLKRFLNSVFLEDELAERVRKAFDAYIFLSYRKKDRQYANELMRLIHKDPVCRDIAIWYDEYLVPGEEFDSAIEKAMEKSELFTLLVTPNLINERNYVEKHEYPKAQKLGMGIFPVEVVDTDRSKLEGRYPSIPKCVRTEDETLFRVEFEKAVKHIARTESDTPEHNFLIGLAYLEGIDVEVDKARAEELIRGAAEADLPEAMEKLANMYQNGVGVEQNMELYLDWYKKLVRHYEEHKDIDDDHLMAYKSNLAGIYNDFGNSDKAIEIHTQVFEYYRDTFGEENKYAMRVLNNIACDYSHAGRHRKALEVHEKVYEILRRTLGEEDRETLSALNSVASEYGYLGDNEKSIEMLRELYEIQQRVLGDLSIDTICTLNNLAYAYWETEKPEEALRIYDSLCENASKALGEEHEFALGCLNNKAAVLGDLDRHEEAIEINKKVYEIKKRIFTEEHPTTLRSLNNLGVEYAATGNYDKALELFEQVLEPRERVLGEENPETYQTILNLAEVHIRMGDHDKAVQLYERLVEIERKVLGDEHPDTLRDAHSLAYEYGETGEHKKALDLYKKVYEGRKNVLGEDDRKTLSSLGNLAYEYAETGDHETALKLKIKVYEKRQKVLGKDDPATLRALYNLAKEYRDIGDSDNAAQYAQQAYEEHKRVLGENDPDTEKCRELIQGI